LCIKGTHDSVHNGVILSRCPPSRTEWYRHLASVAFHQPAERRSISIDSEIQGRRVELDQPIGARLL
jgi:hypothetical protein